MQAVKQVHLSRNSVNNHGIFRFILGLVIDIVTLFNLPPLTKLLQEFSTDIVIIGGGFGGLICAIKARDLGHSVIVLEREKETGYPVRTSGATYVDDMNRFDIPETLYHKVEKCIFASQNNSAEFVDNKKRICILDIRGVLQHLAEKAAKAGAEIFLSTNATKVNWDGDKVIGCEASRFSQQLSFKSQMLIDASGFTNFINGQLKDKPKKNWTIFGLGAEYEAYVENLDELTTMLLVGSDVAPSGYAWVFPTGKNRARIGVGVTKPKDPANPMEYLDNMLKNRPRALKDFGRIVPLEFHVGSIPVAEVPEKIAGKGWMMIGDAACQANPIVGEGIRQAMIFGEHAAKIASEAIKKQDFSEKILSKYEELWNDEFEKKYKIGRIIQKKISEYSDEKWDDGIDTLKILDTDEFYSFIKSDFSKKFLFGLVTRHPKLAANSIVKLITGLM